MSELKRSINRFRILAINGNHIAIVNDFATWQDAVDARRDLEHQQTYGSETWFDIVPLLTDHSDPRAAAEAGQ